MIDSYNLSNYLDAVARSQPEELAIIQGDNLVTWRQFEKRAGNIASWLADTLFNRQAKVAIYTYNSPAYCEACYACLKGAHVPVNINYRYQEEELLYLFRDADAEAIIIHQDFVARLIPILPRLPLIKTVIVIGNMNVNEIPCNIKVGFFEEIASGNHAVLSVVKSLNDLIILYTSGTTGYPKGVMWRQEDLLQLFTRYMPGIPLGQALREPISIENFLAHINLVTPKIRALLLPPLMHATAFSASMTVLLSGGTIVLMDNPQTFDAKAVLTTITNTQPNAMSIVGDSFGSPLVDELKVGSYDISSLRLITSSGVKLSKRVVKYLIEINPELTLVDGLGSTESQNIGSMVTTKANVEVEGGPVKFEFSETTSLLSPEHKLLKVEPGVKGIVATWGPQPIGYYKDKNKTKSTFIEIESRKYSISGDWAEVNSDGKTFTLLGRGSSCINTGGEKVYPEEVEETIKQFTGVTDAAVVGVPNEKWNEAITAIIATPHGGVDEVALNKFLKVKLASYKTPKHIINVKTIERTPAGKIDYKLMAKIAKNELKVTS